VVFIAAAQEKVINVKTGPVTYTNPASGSEMYSAYCAVCHGATGTGNGPAASAFAKPPINLTMLAKNNNGNYPDGRVDLVLRFGTSVPAHGNIQMPVWSTLFHSLKSGDPPDSGVQTMRIHNLVEYLRSIQAK
jgi:mono/diheme cytochrome c family protein